MDLKAAPNHVIVKRIRSLEKRHTALANEMRTLKGELAYRTGGLKGARRIRLTGFVDPNPNLLVMIKSIRSCIYMGLREAKDIVEGIRDYRNQRKPAPEVDIPCPLSESTVKELTSNFIVEVIG